MWFYSRFSCIPFYCPHFHSGSLAWQEVCDFMSDAVSMSLLTIGPPGLIGCEWFHAKSSCIPSTHCSCSYFFNCLDRLWVISCQVQLCPFLLSSPWPPWFYWIDRKWVIPWSSVMSLLTVLILTLVLWAFQQVSDSMPGSAESLLTALTLTLVWLASQFVSDSMPALVGFLIIILTPTLVMLAWKFVSDPCWVQLCSFSLPLLSYWLDSLWVFHASFSCLFLLFSFSLWHCWLDSEWVFKPGMAAVYLTVLIPTLFFFWLVSKLVISCQIYQLCPFSSSLLTTWCYWLDRKWVI